MYFICRFFSGVSLNVCLYAEQSRQTNETSLSELSWKENHTKINIRCEVRYGVKYNSYLQGKQKIRRHSSLTLPLQILPIVFEMYKILSIGAQVPLTVRLAVNLENEQRIHFKYKYNMLLITRRTQ